MTTAAQDAKVLVTGATGFIGAHVVKTLLDRGYAVRGTVRSTADHSKIEFLQGLIDAGKPLELVEADLLKPDTWPPAVEGCTSVCHVASPFILGVAASDEDKLVKPAVDGTLNVLRPSMKNEGVKKVVLVSSIVSIISGIPMNHLSALPEAIDGITISTGRWDTPCEGRVTEPEKLWSVPDKCEPYAKSKTLAEKAAWDMVNRSGGDDGSVDLAVVNPSLVMGPSLTKNLGTSVDLCTQMLTGKMMAVPHVCVNVVDVRDVAEGIVRAMEKPAATGERVVLSQAAVWLKDLANTATPIFQPLGYSLPQRTMPGGLLRFLSWFMPSLRTMAKSAGTFYDLDNTKAKTLLDLDFIPYQDTFVSMCHSVIEHGLVPKTKAYMEREKDAADS